MSINKPLDLEHLINPDNLACEISRKYITFNTLRQTWIEEKKELRNYLYATDTTTTSNKKLPWSNSTTTPKLTQIYDNLKANYSAALFPNSNWMRWQADDRASATKDKRDTIQAYMENKLRQGKFEGTADKLIDDFILYGNCFATVEFETNVTEIEGERIPGYIGPKLSRISPYDIVFDPTVSDFKDSPKIIRSLTSLGEIKAMAKGGDLVMESLLERIMANRHAVVGAGRGVDQEKSQAFVADGFSSIENYYSSEYVELLTFYGDIFDVATGELKDNVKVVVADRAYLVSEEPIASWLGEAPIFHAGWRSRPDNLYAMGPLDNLVGMQYRIDHLENLRADVFDQIALPMLKIKGDVEDFVYEPGGRIYIGEEGDVGPLVPDTTALNADMQIQALENKMEELAGAPRQAMGIRTPGEKTAFEVQTLQNSASRIFQHKAAKFEREFIEPALNAMLESARRNMDVNDLIRVLDDATGAFLFRDITKEDITAKGSIIPIGARHFAERAQRVQNINQLIQIKQDPTIGAHISGKTIAKILAEELGEKELYGENISVIEQMETQREMQDAEADNEEDLMVAAEQGL